MPSARRAVLVILDGLRRDLVNAEQTPHLAALARSATWFANHQSVFPSVTRVCSATIATGCHPRRHELAGNTMVLREDGRLVLHDAGHPDFLQHKRRVTGHSLAAPTLAERLAGHGGAVIFSNVSPGAAYAHDPDGHGHVYHRAGSFGPGRNPVPDHDALHIGPDINGDRAMTERFVNEILEERKPALAVLWLGHPDTTQHVAALGSPQHRAALFEADRHAGMVIRCVGRLRSNGEDVLLLVGSDHGHQTVTGTIDIGFKLVAAGLKDDSTSHDVVVAPNGTAALIYLSTEAWSRVDAIAAYLDGQPWIDRIIVAGERDSAGHGRQDGLAIAVAMRTDDAANAHGVPGLGLIAQPSNGKDAGIGFGQHGGLGAREQAPFLIAEGAGFKAREVHRAPTSLLEIAPTIVAHLGIATDGMDGRALQTLNNSNRGDEYESVT